MRVDRISLRELQIPLKQFFETSFGRVTRRRVLLVTADCEGVEGWAECVAAEGPFFSYEWIDTAWATIREFLAPALLRVEISCARDVGQHLKRVRGHNMPKAALENALWDAEARQSELPLWKLPSGTLREIAWGVEIGTQHS